MEKEIHAAEGLNGPGPTDGYNRGPDFTLEHVVIGPGYESAPLDEGPHIGGGVGKIGWGTQQDTLSCEHFINNIIEHVRLDGTVFVLVLKAFVTGLTAGQGGSGHLDKFRFYSFRLQFVEDEIEENGCIAVFPGAAVKGDNFHDFPCLRHYCVIID